MVKILKIYKYFFVSLSSMNCPNKARAFNELRRYRTSKLLCVAFFTTVPKNGPKIGPKFKKRRKMTKIIWALFGHSI